VQPRDESEIFDFDHDQRLKKFVTRNCEVAATIERSKALMMASLKITVPSGRTDSVAYKDVPKVSIAASAYNTPVQWVKGTRIQNGS
jgi:hypothetical protein